jgi:hypothetical protein
MPLWKRIFKLSALFMKSALIFLLVFVSTYSFSQRNIFVDVANGDDNLNSGLSVNSPFKTIQKVFSVLQTGDNVQLRQGEYSVSGLNLLFSGTAANYLTIKSFQSETVIIDGSLSTSQRLLNISSQHHIRLQGIHFRNSTGLNAYGINVDGISHHIEIKDCKISQIRTNQLVGNIANCNTVNALPIKICGSTSTPITDVLIDNCEVFDCQTGCSEAISLSGNINGFVISNNKVHDISNIGIVAAGQFANFCPGICQNGLIKGNTVYRCVFPELNINSTASGIYIDGASNTIAEQNRVFKCQVGMQLGCENIGKIANADTIRNNVIYDNEKWGIGLGGFAGFVENAIIINNTLFKNNSFFNGSFFGDFGEILLQKVRNSQIYNNILEARFQGENAVFMKWEYPGELSSMVLDHNNYYNSGSVSALLLVRNGLPALSYAAYVATGQDVNSFTSSPEFLSPNLPQPDLHLKINSPAINTGNNTVSNKAGFEDFDKNSRKIGNIELGAYESQPCPKNYKLFGNFGSVNAIFKTTETLSSESNLSGINNNLTYQANNSILLKPGFAAEAGVVFKALIMGCN